MSKRSERLKSQLGKFIQQYARKACRGFDPNDRHYDRKLEQQIKRMKPEELDELLRDESDGTQ
jgi:hypothetical protein